MPGWGKNNYDTVDGAVNLRNRPYRFDNTETKSSIIATEQGWVRRTAYTDIHGKNRVKDEIIVFIQDLDTTLGASTPVEIWSETTASTGAANIFVAFSEPVEITSATPRAALTLTLDGTSGGNTTHLFICSPDDDADDINDAGNILRFRAQDMTSGTYSTDDSATAVAGKTAFAAVNSAALHNVGDDSLSANTAVPLFLRTSFSVDVT